MLIVLACLAGLGVADAQTLSPQEFTQKISRDLSAAMPNVPVTIASELQLRFRREGKTGLIGLADLYKRYSEKPELYPRIVRGLTEQLSQLNMPGSAARENIIPFVRTRAWLAELQKSHNARKPADVAIYEKLNTDLIIVYAENDNKGGARILSPGEKLPVARDDLKALALANLERMLPNPELYKPVPEAEVYGFVSQDPHASSLLLIDRLWTDGRIKVKGDIVVSIPVRKAVLIAGSRDPIGLEAMRVATAKFLEDGLEVQTDQLFVYRNGKWAKFGRKRKTDASQE